MPFNVRGFWFWWQKCPVCKKWLPDIEEILINHYELMHMIFTTFEKPMPKWKYFNITLDDYIIMPQLEEKYEQTVRFSDFAKIGDTVVITKIGELKETENNAYKCRTISVRGQSKPVFVLEAGILRALNFVKDEVSESDPLKVVLSEYSNDQGTGFLTIKNV